MTAVDAAPPWPPPSPPTPPSSPPTDEDIDAAYAEMLRQVIAENPTDYGDDPDYWNQPHDPPPGQAALLIEAFDQDRLPSSFPAQSPTAELTAQQDEVTVKGHEEDQEEEMTDLEQFMKEFEETRKAQKAEMEAMDKKYRATRQVAEWSHAEFEESYELIHAQVLQLSAQVQELKALESQPPTITETIVTEPIVANKPPDDGHEHFAPSIRSARTLAALLAIEPHPEFLPRSPSATPPAEISSQSNPRPPVNKSFPHPIDMSILLPGTDLRSHRHPPDPDKSFKLIATSNHLHCPAHSEPSLKRPGTDIRRHRVPPDIRPSIAEPSKLIMSPPGSSVCSFRVPPDPYDQPSARSCLPSPGTDIRCYRVPPDIFTLSDATTPTRHRPGTSELSFRVPPDPSGQPACPDSSPTFIAPTSNTCSGPGPSDSSVSSPAPLSSLPSRPGTSQLAFRVPPDPQLNGNLPLIPPELSWLSPPLESDVSAARLEAICHRPQSVLSPWDVNASVITPGTCLRKFRRPPDRLIADALGD